MEILRCENVCKNYTIKEHILEKSYKKEILKDINFSLNSGENLAILGESGSGKSTLGRVLCNLEDPSSGGVYYRGNLISYLSFEKKRKFRKNIQYIFQNPNFNPRKSVKNSLNDVARNFGLRDLKIGEFLDKLNLNVDILDKKAFQLSGGMKMRAAILRALILQPEILILDEMTSGLDFKNRSDLIALLKNLGINYIFITHDLGLVSEFDAKTIVIKNGEISV